MELRALEYFLAVAREESISGAAQTLHITQPALSRQMMNLEHELGCQLLVRGPRKVTLTEEGMLLRKRASEIVELVGRTEAEIRATEEDVSGDIHIGGGESHVMRLVADVMKEMADEHPGVRFHIFSGDAESVVERLDKGLLDFGLLISSPKVDRYESLEVPAVDRWGVLMRANDPLATRSALDEKELHEIPLLVSRQRHVDGSYGEGIDFRKLNVKATYNLVNNAAIMVQAGLASALTLEGLVNTEGTGLAFVPLKTEVRLPSHIVWKGSQPLTRASAAFLERMRERFC